ncbi:unnamed protein product [Symbiodinium sp. CCMP2592]|nr:unnamed protein product [Symbiodinium sp. CCMP2592]
MRPSGLMAVLMVVCVASSPEDKAATKLQRWWRARGASSSGLVTFGEGGSSGGASHPMTTPFAAGTASGLVTFGEGGAASGSSSGSGVFGGGGSLVSTAPSFAPGGYFLPQGIIEETCGNGHPMTTPFAAGTASGLVTFGEGGAASGSSSGSGVFGGGGSLVSTAPSFAPGGYFLPQGSIEETCGNGSSSGSAVFGGGGHPTTSPFAAGTASGLVMLGEGGAASDSSSGSGVFGGGGSLVSTAPSFAPGGYFLPQGSIEETCGNGSSSGSAVFGGGGHPTTSPFSSSADPAASSFAAGYSWNVSFRP